MSEPQIDIRPDHWAIVRDILQRHVPQYAVWAFGSRAKWTAKEYSDLDLAIITDSPLPLATSAALAEDFSESDLPWKVDIVDWAETSETFRKIIERDRVVVQEVKGSLNVEDEWPLLTLREAGVSLTDCDHRTPPAAEVGYPYVAIPQLRGGRIELRSARKITPEHFAEWTRKAKPSENDVVLSRRCNPGETAFVSQESEFALGQNLVLLRANGDHIYPPFLRWMTQGPDWWDQVKKFINVGAVFDSLKCADVPKFELKVPPFKEQRAIAHILGTLDDRIELNRRMNETLETMARSLFKSWFVDFDGVPAEGMHESELGLIPKGWNVISFGDVAQQGKGTVTPLASPEEVFTHYSLPAFDIAQLPVQELGEAIKSNKTPVPNESVLVSKLNPHIPRIWLVGDAGHNAVCSTEFIVWTPKQPANSAFIYVLASSVEFNSAMRQLVTGTSNSHQRVKPEQLANIRVIAANDEAISKFSVQVKPLMEKILHHRQQNQQLAQLRDTLLPKLISGEVRIRDAERLAETA